MRYRKSCVTGGGLGASPGASRVVGTGWPASWRPKAIHFASKESSPISAWATNSGPETTPGTAPGAVPLQLAPSFRRVFDHTQNSFRQIGTVAKIGRSADSKKMVIISADNRYFVLGRAPKL